MTSRVHIYKEGHLARIRPKFLSAERFYDFRMAVDGVKIYRGQRFAELDKIPVILLRLREAGFDVTVESSLTIELQERTAQQWIDLKGAQDRIDKIDAELFARTGNRLYPFQRIGCQWLTLRKAALLGDEQGLGKTLETIVALPANTPTVVIAPAVAKGVWKGEVEKWRPHIDVKILKGRDSFRWPKPGEMLVTNYDILPDIHDRMKCDGKLPAEPCVACKDELVFQGNVASTVKRGHVETCTGFLPRKVCRGCHPFLEMCPENVVVVADEAHNVKNSKAIRTISFIALAEAARKRGGRTWLLTGTPLENEPKELWNVFHAAGLAEEAFGNWPTFVDLFKGVSTSFGYKWSPSRITESGDITERMRRVSLRRMRTEVLPELPTKVWQEIEVDIDDKTFSQCERFIKSAGGIDKFIELLEKEKISFETMSSIRSALATAKIPALLQFVDEFEKQKEPIVVFSAHRAPIDALAKRKGWAVITGDVESHKKREIEEKFQRGELLGVGCTIRAGGVAITLTRANLSIFVDRDWKPTANAQAEDRICRIGQKRGCIIMILKANHALDKRVTEVLLKKSKLIHMTVDASSVGPDSQSDKEFEDYVHQMQSEIADAGGRVTRRMAESQDEKIAISNLQLFEFLGKDERLANQLAEEAETVGLSDKQWELALRVVQRGREIDSLEAKE